MMATIDLIAQGEPVPDLEIGAAHALLDVTGQVIDGLDQETWENMASGPRSMDTNDLRIMAVVLDVTGVTDRGEILDDGSDLLLEAKRLGVRSLTDWVKVGYPELGDVRTLHEVKFGWDPRSEGEYRPTYVRNAANVIRSAGVTVITPRVGITRKIPRSLSVHPDERALWF